MKKLLKSALEKVSKGERVTLVTIVSSEGSTPRKAGAIMAVGQNGIICSTVGGGELEYRCINIAMETVGMRHFELDNSKAAELGMVCGGSVEVLFTPVNDAESLENALELSENPYARLELYLDGEGMNTSISEKLPKIEILEDVKAIALPLVKNEKVIIFGGGHVSLALSQLLDLLEIAYSVIDEREEFCNRERFPKAEQVCTAADNISFDENTAVCIMTRGHAGDTEALKIALRSKAGYIGLMGSRRKKEKTFALLKEEGFVDAEKRIRTPIGLDIGAQTPMEIAVSVAGEIIKWKALH